MPATEQAYAMRAAFTIRPRKCKILNGDFQEPKEREGR